jgi:fumarate hydratase subunit alpha
MVFVQIGSEVHVETGAKTITEIIVESVREAYKENYFRNSVINDPLLRSKVVDTIPMVYIDFVKGQKVKISILVRGAGCENVTTLRMFVPDATLDTISTYIIETSRQKLVFACPPVAVGIGIGGDATKAVLLSKKSLLQSLNEKKSYIDPYSRLRKSVMIGLSKTNPGQVLDVLIEHMPCHIASLPVAISLQCNSFRRASKII